MAGVPSILAYMLLLAFLLLLDTGTAVVDILSVPGVSTIVGVPADFCSHAVIGVSAVAGVLLLTLLLFLVFSPLFISLPLLFGYC